MTAQSDEQKMIAFIMKLPPTANPYNSIAGYLVRETAPLLLPIWARIVMAVIMAGYVIMFLQSLHLIYIRIVTKTFRFHSFTRLGIVKIDVPNLTCFIYFLYSLLALADLTFQQLMDAKLVSGRQKLTLFGSKFSILLAGSWAYIWVCFCQCVSTLWDESWNHSIQRPRLSAPLRWSLNMGFVVASFWAVPILILTFLQANSEFEKLRHTLNIILSDLHHQATTYNGTGYNRMELLLRLQPASMLGVYRDRLALWIRRGIIVGLVDLIILGIIYAPLLIVSIGALRRRTAQCTFTAATGTAEESLQFQKIEARLRVEQQTIVMHAYTAYALTVIFVPVMAWQLSYKGSTFLKSETCLIITQIVCAVNP
ncbi:hypothetical protein CROQUDRAFT_670321 [Cronartium quercuum f. sp. fusiforme G11]|uniref:Uncharacterized protein n=1 Tax=Cronartium quercuum f. sp. fusiforme G11 TaxID=708437 RepID=A0A9P6TCW2_9BASI|nr:hypothetical protein CROQUDRAFT_670321 [Cronartium quercuum f. sp. fusiforme G11]